MSTEPADAHPPTWHDPPDVNDRVHGGRPAAGNRLAQRLGAEDQALSGLSGVIAGRYRALAEALGDDLPRAALQDLLLDGKLADGRLLGPIETLAAQPLAEGLERDRLLTEVMREVAEPAAINQRLHATCGAAAAQMLLAHQDPAEYVRLVAGLATPAGRVKTRGGVWLAREAGTEEPGRVRKGPGGPWAKDARSEPSRLFQSAAMELANGFAEYDPTKDRHTDVRGLSLGQGLSQEGVSMLVSTLLGCRVTTMSAKADRESAMQHVESALAAGRPVPVGLAWNQRDEGGRVHAYHELVAIASDAERVYYLNPWGRQESMARADFIERLEAASLLAPAGWADRLRGLGAWVFLGVLLAILVAGAFGLSGR